MLKIGAVGHKNHAGKVLDIVNDSKLGGVEYVYHPDKLVNHPRATQNLEDLYSCDVIFILSPDHTHFEYLELFSNNFNGYIFCEKPPAVSLFELKKLKTFDRKRIFFNFNLRYSQLALKINDVLTSGQLGKVLHIDAVTTHGLAFSKKYISSWRGDNHNNGDNIVMTKSIHYVDLLVRMLGQPDQLNLHFSSGANQSHLSDTCNVFLAYNEGPTGSVFASYAAPYNDRLFIYGTNGQLEYDGNKLLYLGPRDTFDSSGRYEMAPSTTLTEFSSSSMWTDSLRNSVIYFLNAVNNKVALDDFFESSIVTTRLLLGEVCKK